MIDEIDILHECHSGDFPCHSGEKTTGLLCIVSYHHEIVIELGKYGFDAFAEFLVSPCGRTPVFLIQAIWDLKGYVCSLKEIFLSRRTEIAFVSKHQAVMIFPLHILEKIDVVDACRCNGHRNV